MIIINLILWYGDNYYNHKIVTKHFEFINNMTYLFKMEITVDIMMILLDTILYLIIYGN